MCPVAVVQDWLRRHALGQVVPKVQERQVIVGRRRTEEQEKDSQEQEAGSSASAIANFGGKGQGICTSSSMFVNGCFFNVDFLFSMLISYFLIYFARSCL